MKSLVPIKEASFHDSMGIRIFGNKGLHRFLLLILYETDWWRTYLFFLCLTDYFRPTDMFESSIFS